MHVWNLLISLQGQRHVLVFLAGGDWITSVGDMAETDIWEVYRYDGRGENFCVQPTFTAELSQQRKPLLI